jgi:hypothetical protein
VNLYSPEAIRLLDRFGVRANEYHDALAAYLDARGRFDGFAGLDAPHLPDDPWDVPQVELCRWQVRNFGPQPATMYALGVAEEFGEFGTASTIEDEHDAIGDVLIYACQLATTQRLAWSECSNPRPFLTRQASSGAAVGLLCHVTLKAAQGIRGLGDPELARFASFIETAAKVVRRDWKRDASAGGEK